MTSIIRGWLARRRFRRVARESLRESMARSALRHRVLYVARRARGEG
jgi:hypothetical protein